MQKKVEEFLQLVKEEEKARREELLLRAHITRKEYSDEAGETYPLYDEEKGKYYREVALEVSDEEWEALKGHLEEGDAPSQKEDDLTKVCANILLGVGSICIAIVFFIYLAAREPALAFSVLMAGIVSISFFIGVLSGFSQLTKVGREIAQAIREKKEK